MEDMRGKHIVLYSSAIATALAAISSLLTFYVQNPGQATQADLMRIQNDLLVIAETVRDEAQIEKVDYNVPVENKTNTIMAWWYPGEPACTALNEASNYSLDVAKPEYFIVLDGGKFELMTESKYGCNGYSEANVKKVKQVSGQQFVVVSSSYAKDMYSFLLRDAQSGLHTKQLVDFVVSNDLSGVELDFEDYGGWTQEIYEQYKYFLTGLGAELHKAGKQLSLVVPAVRNNIEEKWYTFRLSELEKLPIDSIVVMGYDYQYDHGVGEPIAPLSWLKEVISFTKQRIQDNSKIVVGIPSYGYIADNNSGQIKIITGEQAKEYAIYSSAERDNESQELVARGGKMTLVYQDSISIKAKIDAVTESGISKVSVWHLGGNPWFSQ